jgi:hypothetical protein
MLKPYHGEEWRGTAICFGGMVGLPGEGEGEVGLLRD